MTSKAGDEPVLPVLEESNMDLFLADWGEAEFASLATHVEHREFRAGETVIRAAEADRALYLITAGELEVLAPTGQDGETALVATITAGHVVGEQAFLDGHPRSATVRAVSEGEMLRLTVEAFEHFAHREPGLACAFLLDLGRVLSQRLRSTVPHGGVAGAPRQLKVASFDLLPLQRIEVDETARNSKVEEIAASPFFQELYERTQKMRAARGA